MRSSTLGPGQMMIWEIVEKMHVEKG